MTDTSGVAIIGYKTISKAHSHAYRTAPRFFDLPLIPDMRVIYQWQRRCSSFRPGTAE